MLFWYWWELRLSVRHFLLDFSGPATVAKQIARAIANIAGRTTGNVANNGATAAKSAANGWPSDEQRRPDSPRAAGNIGSRPMSATKKPAWCTVSPIRKHGPPPAHWSASRSSPRRCGGRLPGHAKEVNAAMAELQSTITCPHCGHRATETMPTDACWYFYICRGCTMRLRPKEGECCVFCSYGTVPCPSVQEALKGRGNEGQADPRLR